MRKLRDAQIFVLQKEMDCFTFVLADPKRGEQSVERDHIGTSPGLSDTRIGTSEQRFDWWSKRSGGPDSWEILVNLMQALEERFIETIGNRRSHTADDQRH